MKPIAIGVSSCLLGHKIRYDGNDKRNALVEFEICTRFQCVPLCPEYAIGLGVPRDPVHLVKTGENFSVMGITDRSVDVTKSLQGYADFVSQSLGKLCGYIFKARSPSCGLVDTPVFDDLGNEIGKSRGAYAAQVILCNSDLPVIDEIQLTEPLRRREFIQKVEDYSQSINR
jgi:uncharacterized protein YbbK (DUF523 family)